MAKGFEFSHPKKIYKWPRSLWKKGHQHYLVEMRGVKVINPREIRQITWIL